MGEFIERKLRSALVFRIILLLVLVAAIGSFVAMTLVEDVETIIAPLVLSIMALWICGIIYLVSFMPFTRSVKWLKSKELEHVADDIVLDRPTLPRSKIYCGQRALFSKKPCAIIPYAEIAWVYLYERRTNGIVVERSVIINTKDGKRFALNANFDEFKWLLDNYILKHVPDLIIGYGAEQKARYQQLKQNYAQAGKKS